MSVQSTPDPVLAALKTATATLEASHNTAGATVTAAMIAATIALLAALLTLLGAMVSAWVARRNTTMQVALQQKLKHAEFRQDWINVLREQMSRFQALAYSKPAEAATSSDVADAMLRVVMQLNPKDRNYEKLTGLMYDVMNHGRALAGKVSENVTSQSTIVAHVQLPSNPLVDANADFVTVCQDILKTEWDVTKKGLYSLRPEYPKEEEAAVRTLGRLHRLRIGWGPARETKAVPPPPPPARSGWRSIAGRMKAAAAHIYDGRTPT